MVQRPYGFFSVLRGCRWSGLRALWVGNTIVVPILVFSFSCSAATVSVLRLKNGDRLTGSVISETEDNFILQHAVLGELTVPKASVVQRIEKPLEPVSGGEQMVAGSEEGDAAGRPKEGSSGDDQDESNSVSATREKEDPWSFTLEIGSDLRISEVRKRDFFTRFKPRYDKDPWTIVGDFQIEFGKTDKKVTAAEYEGHTRLEYDFGERSFMFNDSRTKRDLIRNLSRTFEDSVGYGRRLIEEEKLKLSLDFGANFLREEFTDGIEQNDFAFRLGEQLEWEISQQLSLDQIFEVFPRFTSSANNFIRFRVNLKYRMTDRLYLALLLKEEFDPKPATGVQKNDFQLRTTVGYDF